MNLRKVTLALAVVVLAVGLAACGGSDDTTSSGTTAADTGETSGGGGGAAVSEARAAVEAAESTSGLEWNLPTEAFDPGKHKVALINFSLADPSAKQHADGWVAAAKAMGWEHTLFNGEASVPKMANFMQQAIQQGYEAIIWDAVDANAMKAPVEAAIAKGIPVACTNCLTKGFGDKVLDASSSWTAQGEAVADWVIAERDGEAKILKMEDPSFPTTVGMFEGFDKRISEACPDCTVESESYTVTEIVEEPGPPSWNAVLATNSPGEITDVVAAYDFGAVAFIKTAEQRGRDDVVISSFQLAPEFALYLANENPLAGSDTAGPQEVEGWASIDQVARAIAGVPQWDATELPFVLATSKNIGELPDGKFAPSDFDYEAAFEKLWK